MTSRGLAFGCSFLCLVLLAASPADGLKPPAGKYVAWHLKGSWVAHETISGKLEKIVIPPPYQPASVAISRDGDLLAFVSPVEGFSGIGLFALRRSTGAIDNIGYSSGLHADPFVASDNTTVYFSYHPAYDRSEPHAVQRKWAQVHKASTGGGAAVALTESQGCHVAPGGLSGDRLYFVYSPCNGQRHLSFLTISSGDETKIPIDAKLRSLTVADDGKEVLLIVERAGFVEVERFDIRTQRTVLVAKYRVPAEIRAALGDKREVFIQHGDEVWVRRSSSTPAEKLSLEERK